ncbi:MAG: peptidase M15 [Flavobacteriales bacterium]|nr:peptidase M15 [Flavobacteriales bacterium]NCA20719.1 peptidase M15 [Crocinitomicaceae bacterium]
MNKVSFLFVLLILFACNENNKKQSNSQSNERENGKESNAYAIDTAKVASESRVLIDSLVDIRSINPDIQVDLKYATADNFMKMRLYERLRSAYLQKDVAERLSKCQELLSNLKSGYRLLVYDAVRPVSVQQKMWDALDSIPPSERGKFVSNPQNRSLHNMGAAVDLTIIDERGIPLDMGAGYDDIRKIAYPTLEQEFLAKGELTEKHISNRELLRKVMKSQDFRPLETEWWHFNACSRPQGKAKYKVLMEEP